VDYLFKAMQRASGVTAEAVAEPEVDGSGENAIGLRESEAIAQETASSISAPAPQVITSPSLVEKVFALRSQNMSEAHMHAFEQFRVLRSRLLETMRTANMRTLLVTSSVAGEGKSVTSLNLAFALSRVKGLRILLVDADLRKPSIAGMIGIPVERGLLHYLKSGVPLSEIVLHLGGNLDFIPSLGSAENSAELLHTAEMRELLRNAREMYDIAIFDAPPLLAIADARVMSSAVDGVLFCIRAESTPEGTIRDAVALVSKKVVGAVLVGTHKRSHNYYGYYGRGGRKD
jgi:non-specific protein-tyrosine kinase